MQDMESEKQMNVTEQTRRDSYEKTDRAGRQIEIIEAFRQNGKMTVRECMEFLKRHDMNEVRPRITELCEKGMLVKTGTKYDTKTERMVTVYDIYDRGKKLC